MNIELKFMSSFRSLLKKSGGKYYFIITFIQIISVFCGAQIPVYLTSIFAKSFMQSLWVFFPLHC